jgi:transcriptional regulator with XRE-family HTH domain
MTDRYTAARLGSVLAAQGRSQRWVARQVGVSESLLSHAQAGRRSLDRALAERVAVVLGVPFAMLFDSLHRDDSTLVCETAA